LTVTDLTRETLRAASEALYDSARALCHETYGVIPAPAAYELMADLSASADLIRQALERLPLAVARSLEDDRIEIYEDGGVDPIESIGMAGARLITAATLAERLSSELDAAREAICGQGWRAK
jgi:hypothetical protein